MTFDRLPPAPGDSLLGRLQRGTGAGHLAAIAADRKAARADLTSAIRLDWRWDSQLDSRSWYYACLADHFRISSGEIESLILSTRDSDPHDAADKVAVGVLREFASWGDVSARDRLIDYVRYGGSPEVTVGWCDAQGSSDDLDRLQAALSARFPNEASVAGDMADRSELIFWLERLAARDDRFSRFVGLLATATAARGSNHNAPPRPAAEHLAGMTFEQACHAFLSAAWSSGLGPREIMRWRSDALTWLGDHFFPSHTGRLVELLLAEHPEFNLGRLADLAAFLPVEEWPAFTRRALADGRPGPRWAARGLLTRSERPDVELVRHCLRAALAANDMYPTCDMLDIVKRVRIVELVPEVELAYRDATYSYGARMRAVETLVELTPDLFRAQYARECLWDCEEYIVEIGCQHVDPVDLDVRRRLEFLRDAFEPSGDDEPKGVHRLARERLGY